MNRTRLQAALARYRAMAFVALQHLLPRYLLTALFYRLARLRWRPLKDFLIRRFVALYDVNTAEIDGAIPDDFATFNDFFTRELAAGQRPVDRSAGAIVAPVDGTISVLGSIDREQILQAKGLSYSVADLLQTDLEEAARYVDGHFITLYLAPYNYHRIHAPLAGELVAARYVPGDLFSVNAATVSRLPQLFTRNERLVCHFATASGPLLLVMVGAMNVGSITTRWSGELRPRQTGVVAEIDLAAATASRSLDLGDLLGWFNFGSTVIVLTPPGSTRWAEDLGAGCRVQMGQRIGTVAAAAT